MQMFDENSIKHCFATKYVDVELNDQTVSNMFERRTKCFTMFDQKVDVVQILSNTIQPDQTRCPNGKMFAYQRMFDRV